MRKGDTVTQMRGPDAGEFARVLARFHQRNGIGADFRRAAVGANNLDESAGRSRRVEAYLLVAGRSAQGRLELSRLLDLGPFAQSHTHILGELCTIEIKPRLSFARNQCV